MFGRDRQRSARQHALLAAAHDPMTLHRLAEIGVGDGWDALEVGAGGGSVARWLAERVAPSGRVLATDVTELDLPPLAGLRCRVHDVVADPLPESAFDVVVARLVLRHLPQRWQVLDKLVRALKPGGWLQVDEFDTSYEPPLLTPDEPSARLYEKFLSAKESVMLESGVDPKCGRHVPAAMRAAGLEDIDPRPHVQLRQPGSPDLELMSGHARNLRAGLLAAGMTDDELDQLPAITGDAQFRASSSVMYSVQGRKAVR